jgi:hypothetical protein
MPTKMRCVISCSVLRSSAAANTMDAAGTVVIFCADRGCACSMELSDIEAIHKAVAEGEQRRGQTPVHAAAMCQNILCCVELCNNLHICDGHTLLNSFVWPAPGYAMSPVVSSVQTSLHSTSMSRQRHRQLEPLHPRTCELLLAVTACGMGL